MPVEITKLRILISSPGDVVAERDIAAEIVNELSTALPTQKRLTLEAVRWESHALPGVGDYIQKVVQPQLGDFDIFVCIFWTRIGTKTPVAKSGTVEELNWAISLDKMEPNTRKILVYFSSQEIAPNQIEAGQFKGLQEFREELNNRGVFSKTYSTREEFGRILKKHISQLIEEYGKTWGPISQQREINKEFFTTHQKRDRVIFFSEVMKSINIYKNQSTADFQKLIGAARAQIDVLQTYVPIIEAIKPALQSAYENGCKIRILVLKDDSRHLEARLIHLGRSKDAMAHSLSLLRKIVRDAKNPKGKIEIRAYDFLPYFPYYRIDGRVFTGFYLSGGSYRYPQIEFNADELIEVFPELLEHFEEYWNRKDNIDLIRNWNIQELVIHAGLPIITSYDECEAMSRDASLYRGHPIGVVRFSESSSTSLVAPQLEGLLKIAKSKKLPLTFVGSRTSLAGQAVNRNGIVVDMSTFKTTTVMINDPNPYADVEPGVILDQLNTHIKARTKNSLISLEFEHTLDLSSSHMATIGGAILNNGGGILSTKYGSARDNIYDLEVLLPNGRRTWTSEIKEKGLFADLYKDLLKLIEEAGSDKIIDAYPKMRKNSCGYNLRPLAEQVKNSQPLDVTQIFAGSEGTLGILLRAKIKIWQIAAPKSTVLAFFDSFNDVSKAIEEILGIEVNEKVVVPAALELISGSIFEVIKDLRIELPPECEPPNHAKEAVLLIEYDDPEEIAHTAVEKLKVVCGHYIPYSPNNNSNCFRVIENEDKRKNFWFLRKNVVKILNDYARKYDLIAPPIIEDIAVPISNIGTILAYLQREFDTRGLKAAIFGHAGDGNLHVRPLIKRDPEQMEMAWQLMDQVYKKVVSLNGTITAEHGDGLLRTPYLGLQYGTAMTTLFKRIKELFDPDYILNPGIKVPNLDYPNEGFRQWDIFGYLPTGGGKPFHPDYEDKIH